MDPIKVGIIAAGIASLALSLFHIPQVWQRFFSNWTSEVQTLSVLNRKLINTVLIALSLMLLVFAFTSLAYADELSRGSGLALGLTITYSAFWLWRALWQIVYFRPSRTEHNRLLLVLHYSVVVISIGNTVVYSLPLLGTLQ